MPSQIMTFFSTEMQDIVERKWAQELGWCYRPLFCALPHESTRFPMGENLVNSNIEGIGSDNIAEKTAEGMDLADQH